MPEVFWSERFRISIRERDSLFSFLNAMSKRIIQGHARYGPPDSSKLYLKRMELELKAYKKSGNMESLYNIANYCWLESYAPQNPKFHFDAYVDSITRGKV